MDEDAKFHQRVTPSAGPPVHGRRGGGGGGKGATQQVETARDESGVRVSERARRDGELKAHT